MRGLGSQLVEMAIGVMVLVAALYYGAQLLSRVWPILAVAGSVVLVLWGLVRSRRSGGGYPR